MCCGMMRRGVMVACVAAAGAGWCWAQGSAPSAAAAPAAPPDPAPADVLTELHVIVQEEEAPGTSFFSFADAGGAVTFKFSGGELVEATRNGQDVPRERVRREGTSIWIVDEKGEKLGQWTATPPASGLLSLRPRVVRSRPGEALGIQRERMLAAPAAGATMVVTPPNVMVGVQMAEPDPSLRGHFGLKAGESTMLSAVYEDLPAGKAGLSPYDIIVAVEGESTAGEEAVRKAIRSRNAGESLSLTVLQKGERKNVTLTLEAYDAAKMERARVRSIPAPERLAEISARGMPGGAWQQWVPPDAVPGLPEEYQSMVREYLSLQGESRQAFVGRLRGGADPSGMTFFMAPATPSAPVPPPMPPGSPDVVAAAPSGSADASMKRMEERMARLEALLERLAAERTQNR